MVTREGWMDGKLLLLFWSDWFRPPRSLTCCCCCPPEADNGHDARVCRITWSHCGSLSHRWTLGTCDSLAHVDGMPHNLRKIHGHTDRSVTASTATTVTSPRSVGRLGTDSDRIFWTDRPFRFAPRPLARVHCKEGEGRIGKIWDRLCVKIKSCEKYENYGEEYEHQSWLTNWSGGTYLATSTSL